MIRKKISTFALLLDMTAATAAAARESESRRFMAEHTVLERVLRLEHGTTPEQILTLLPVADKDAIANGLSRCKRKSERT